MYPPQQPPPGYYPPAVPPPPPKRSTSKVMLIVVGLIGGVCILGMAAGKGDTPPAGSATPAAASATPSPTHAAAPAMAAAEPTREPVAVVPAPAAAQPTPPPATAPAATGESAEDAVPVGTTVSVAGLEATVLGARLTRRVSHHFMRHEAPEGSTLLILQYRVRNTTHEAIQALSFADAVLVGGSSYEPSPACAMAVNTLGMGDTLNPGLPRTFEACFEVPPDGHGFVAKFNRAFTDRFAQTGL